MRAIVTATLPSPVRTVVLADSEAPPLADLDGYSFEDILSWLTGNGTGPSSLMTWEITPQVNSWAVSLGLLSRLRLFSSQQTAIGQWRLLFVPGKFLEVRRLRRLWRLYDASGFWSQGSRLADLAGRWGTYAPPRLLPDQLAMREEWRDRRLPSIALACQERALSINRLMERVLARLEAHDLKPSRLHGVGAIASRLLREAGAQRWVAKFRPDRQPTCNGQDLLPLMLAAYYGGRTETTVAGSWSVPTYDYDLRSAYPWALAWMPPVGYRWEETSTWTNDLSLRMSLWYVRWDIPFGSLGPLPFRRQNGSTVYPLSGQGWYWWPEVRSALAAYGESAIRVLRGYTSPGNSAPLLADMIRTRYAQRRALEATDDPTAEILKGALQSVYGRFAQTLGQDGVAGYWYNPALAGWITSAVRARIIDACRGREGYVCAISTDGILTTRRLGIAPSDRLGAWRVERYQQASLVLPGLYNLVGDAGDHLPLRHKGSSGLPPGVPFATLLDDLTRWGKGSYPTTWFVPNILPDLYPDRWEQHRCRWTATRSEVDPYAIASKRDGAESILNLDWRNDFTWTRPYGRISDLDSEPYPGPPAWQPGGVSVIDEAMLRATRT